MQSKHTRIVVRSFGSKNFSLFVVDVFVGAPSASGTSVAHREFFRSTFATFVSCAAALIPCAACMQPMIHMEGIKSLFLLLDNY
jgi:hypothetical protein